MAQSRQKLALHNGHSPTAGTDTVAVHNPLRPYTMICRVHFYIYIYNPTIKKQITLFLLFLYPSVNGFEDLNFADKWITGLYSVLLLRLFMLWLMVKWIFPLTPKEKSGRKTHYLHAFLLFAQNI